MKSVIVLLFLGLGACAKNGVDPCASAPQVDMSKPGVLVVGDSISLGYTPDVRAALPQVDVIHSPCNDMSTSNAMALRGMERDAEGSERNMDSWVGYRPHWKVITFNHGFWDIAPNTQATSLEEYASNLRAEAMLYQAHADHVIFVLSTQVSPKWTAFTEADVEARNQVASQVMAELDVPVLDLNAVSAPINDTEHDSSNIHWTAAGYSVLGAAVAQAISSY